MSGRAPILVQVNGLDSTKEMRYRVGLPAWLAARGVSSLVVDQPGTGEALRLLGMTARYDSEHWASPIVDWLEARDDVDPKRIGMEGVSLGGYFCPRAVAFEPRFACGVAWGANHDWRDVQKRRREREGNFPVPHYWAHVCWVWGARDVDEFMAIAERVHLDGVVERISVPFLVTHGEKDSQIPLKWAHRTYEQLVNSPKRELKVFTEREGGVQHSSFDNSINAGHYIADWVAETCSVDGRRQRIDRIGAADADSGEGGALWLRWRNAFWSSAAGFRACPRRSSCASAAWTWTSSRSTRTGATMARASAWAVRRCVRSGTLGILDAFLAQGSATDNVEIRLPHGPVVATLPTPRIAGPDVPGGGAIMRPVLARILAEATRAAGVDVRLGTAPSRRSIDSPRQRRGAASRDGQRGRYDLVIGADGLHSKVRQAVFPEAPKPRYTGQAVWRAVVPRSPDIKTVTMWLGPTIKPGVNPVSKTEMYVFITEPRPTSGEHIAPEELAPRMRALLDGFPDPVLQSVRAQLGPESQIVFRPIDSLLVPQPWFRGRVVLIGDTVHATTPHLAAGACIGIEDALVLAEELERASDVEGALVAFQDRRWDRCRMVVENSARLGEIEISGGDKDEHSRIIRESLMALAQTI